MGIFKLNMDAGESKRVDDEIEARIQERLRENGDFILKENTLASPVLNYSNADVEDLPYELFRAREYVKIFPEEDPFSFEKTSKIRRFYHRVVRRLLRQQIVFNEFMLSASEEIWGKLKDLEDRISALEKNKSGTGHGNGTA